jgi:hypothetical protein
MAICAGGFGDDDDDVFHLTSLSHPLIFHRRSFATLGGHFG